MWLENNLRKNYKNINKKLQCLKIKANLLMQRWLGRNRIYYILSEIYQK